MAAQHPLPNAYALTANTDTAHIPHSQSDNANVSTVKRRGRPAGRLATNTNTHSNTGSNVRSTPQTAAQNEVASSNKTTNLFLGTNQRSWMKPVQIPPGNPSPLHDSVPLDPRRALAIPAAVTITSHLTPHPLSPVASSSVTTAITSSVAGAEEPSRHQPVPTSTTTPPYDAIIQTQRDNRTLARPPEDERNTTQLADNDIEVVDLTCSQEDYALPELGPTNVDFNMSTDLVESTIAESDIAALINFNPGATANAALTAAHSDPQRPRLSSTASRLKRPLPHSTIQQSAQFRPWIEPFHVSLVPERFPPPAMFPLPPPQIIASSQASSTAPRPIPQSTPSSSTTVSPGQNFINPTILPPDARSTITPLHSQSASRPMSNTSQGRMYLANFDTQLSNIRQRVAIPAVVEAVRLPWLRAACQVDDFMFLLLHQMLCMRRAYVPLLRHCGVDGHADLGFAILEQIFGSNDLLPAELLVFLATWPNTTYSLKVSPELNLCVRHVVRFLHNIVARWLTFCDKWRNRRLPPMAREIVEAFGTVSVILQRAMFMSLHLQIAPTSSKACQMAVYNLFLENQILFHEYQGQPIPDELQRFRSMYVYILTNNMQQLDSRLQPPIPSQLTNVNNSVPNIRQASAQTLIASAPPSSSTVHPSNSQNPASSTNIVNMANLKPNPIRTQIIRHNAPPHIPQLLIPDLNNLPPFLSDVEPEIHALHQAHLRQPFTEVENVEADEIPRLYQFVTDYALNPQPWRPEQRYLDWTFELSLDLMKRKATIFQPPQDSYKLPKRILSSNSVLFNLRSAKLDGIGETPSLDQWSPLQTYWPQSVFISINDQHLEVRRKRQHRRDLPIDVTEYVKEGTNKVIMSIGNVDGHDKGKCFGLSVEVIGFSNQLQALSMPATIPATEALRAITSTMQPAPEDDDEMMVVNDNITLSVTDPWLSRMFSKPVRGVQCKHWECFDHETFLQTRKSDCNDALTSVYEWHCPMIGCGKDVRPCNLVVDGFLQEVRNKLVEEGNPDTRAIVLNKDGSWMAKEDKNEQETNQPHSRCVSGLSARMDAGNEGKGSGQSTPSWTATMTNGAATKPGTSEVVEIVDLDV